MTRAGCLTTVRMVFTAIPVSDDCFGFAKIGD